MAIFPDEAFTFYEGLEADNSKTYWAEHKHIYDRAVKEPLTATLEQLAPAFGGDVFVFRPYRDTRFAKDKSPYKTAQGGLVETEPGIVYYLQVSAEGVLLGGGFHARDRDQTARYRAAVDEDLSGKALEKITSTLEKAGFTIGGPQVRTRPRGVPADHPRLDLMRREYVNASKRVDPDTITIAAIRKQWVKLNPLLEWARQYAPPALDVA
ncbi:DUF2461 domain-containing protein [Catelliglobosispora koreensis]|uniref:DUF2461 domain-containing protein n=1 Tax=Catelliglobosispora koreensis TaxID=129052 RepID=UPI00036566C4|nr:DUF2461 domain-containing protein [Catelliglobosispora koreensis]